MYRSVFAFGLWLAAASFAQATDTNWTGASDNYWNVAGNWSNGIPTATNLYTAVFDSTTGTTVNVNGLSSLNAMTFTGAANYTFTNAGFEFVGANAGHYRKRRQPNIQQ